MWWLNVLHSFNRPMRTGKPTYLRRASTWLTRPGVVPPVSDEVADVAAEVTAAVAEAVQLVVVVAVLVVVVVVLRHITLMEL